MFQFRKSYLISFEFPYKPLNFPHLVRINYLSGSDNIIVKGAIVTEDFLAVYML